MMMTCDDAGTSVVRRFEVFTGAGQRREWSPEVKASIVAESYSGQETACAVARRHGLAPSQLFAWRRDLRKKLEDQGLPLPATPAFVPEIGRAFVEGKSVLVRVDSGVGRIIKKKKQQ